MSHSTPLSTDPGINQDIVIRRSRNATIVFRFFDKATPPAAYNILDSFRFILKPMAESADSEALIDITNATTLVIDANEIRVPLTEANSDIDRTKAYYELRNTTSGQNWYQGVVTITRGLAQDGTETEVEGTINVGDTVVTGTITIAEQLTSAGITTALGYTPMDKLITANLQAASYTLILTDAGKLVEMNVATANNVTVPAHASVAFDIGTEILIAQYGAGQTTIVAGVGVTIRSKDGNLKLTGQYSAASLVKIGADEWYAFGDMTV
jgi:hypothetical protein